MECLGLDSRWGDKVGWVGAIDGGTAVREALSADDTHSSSGAIDHSLTEPALSTLLLPMIRSRLPALLLVLSTGCVLVPEPHSSVLLERPWGIAGGESEEEALHVAAIVEQVLPVFRELEGFEERPLRVHLTDDLGQEGFSGITSEPLFGDSWIAVLRGAEDAEHTVAHEMAHFYFDELQSRFPTVLSEGASELLADRVFPSPKRRMTLMVMAAASYLDNLTIEVRGREAKKNLPYIVQPVPSVEEVFEIGWYDNLQAESRVKAALYGLGWIIAERIGWDGMVALAGRCADEGLEVVPAEWIRSAAGIEPPTQEALRDAIFQAFGEEGAAGDAGLTITLTG